MKDLCITEAISRGKSLTGPTDSGVANICRDGPVGGIVDVDGVVLETAGVDVIVGVLHQSVGCAFLSVIGDGSFGENFGVGGTVAKACGWDAVEISRASHGPV